MSSLYQVFIHNLKQQPVGSEPYFRECATNAHPTEAEHKACRGIQEAAAMRVAVRAVKGAMRLYGGDKDIEPDMDAIQESTIGALQAIGTWDPNNTSSFSGWLSRRAIGAALDWFRRERSYGMGGRDYVADVVDVEDLITDDDSDTTDSPLAIEPLDDIIAEHDTSKIDELVSTLPVELRNIVVSYYGYRTLRMTIAELAARENVSVGTIRNRLREGIALLRINRDI